MSVVSLFFFFLIPSTLVRNARTFSHSRIVCVSMCVVVNVQNLSFSISSLLPFLLFDSLITYIHTRIHTYTGWLLVFVVLTLYSLMYV